MFAKILYYKHIRKKNKRAVQQSKAVTLGYVSEQIAPLLPWFPYNYKDLMFLWKGVDYIVFDWLSSWSLKNIVFLEIKTWKSRLNTNEKQIKSTIDARKVSYELLRI